MSEAITPLPWQQEIWATLQTGYREQRLAHALLLSGPAGVGKRHFVRAFAASLLCESPNAEGIACGACRGCIQRASGTHPNLFWLAREVDDKSGKEKRDIGMEQLRVLGEKLSLSAHYGRAKLAVIDPADALNLSGANALLKTIEEPPDNTYILLISERPQALLPTLRSRCQKLRFAVPDAEATRAWLKQQEPALPPSALTMARGAPLRALELHRSGQLQQAQTWRREWLDVSEQKKPPLAAALSAGRDRDSAQAWLSAFTDFLAELLRARVAGGDLAALGQRTGAGLQLLLDESLDALRRLGNNAQPQLMAESLMIAWWRHTLRANR